MHNIILQFYLQVAKENIEPGIRIRHIKKVGNN